MHREIARFIEHIINEFFLNGRIYFLWFCIYGFVGWAYESAICSQVKYHRFINRGYLKGPICPIYGVGAVANILLLGQIGSAPGLFVAAMLISGVVEYFTSYFMEKLFHQRWWDYTRYRFNLHGRICLYGCVIFGIANLIILKVIHPAVVYLTGRIPEVALTEITILLYVVFLGDVIYTTLHMESVNEKIRIWKIQIQKKGENLRENAVEIWGFAETRTRDLKAELRVMTSEGLTLRLQHMKQQFQDNDWKIRQIVPKLKESRYYEWLEKLKDRFDF